VLSNGDIAVSGGPRQFEMLIYRNDFMSSQGQRDGLVLVDSLDLNRRTAVQILEAHQRFVVVACEKSFVVFFRDNSVQQQKKWFGYQGNGQSFYRFLNEFEIQRQTMLYEKQHDLQPQILMSLVQLSQFKDPNRTWMVSIEHSLSISLWEFTFIPIV
jgi:hypothetical protein